MASRKKTIDTLDATVDSIPGGLVRSTNDGNTWERYTTDVPNNVYVSSLMVAPSGTVYCMATDVVADPRKNAGTAGEVTRLSPDQYDPMNLKVGLSYIYRSTDNGRTWTRVFVFTDRIRMPDTDPRFTVMPDGRILAIHPTAGIAISRNDGVTWSLGDPLNIGDRQVNDVIFADDGYAHLATDDGYVRILTDNILNVKESSTVSGNLRVFVDDDGAVRFPDGQPTSVTCYGLDGRLLQRFADPNGITSIVFDSNLYRVVVVVAEIDGHVLSAVVVL